MKPKLESYYIATDNYGEPRYELCQDAKPIKIGVAGDFFIHRLEWEYRISDAICGACIGHGKTIAVVIKDARRAMRKAKRNGTLSASRRKVIRTLGGKSPRYTGLEPKPCNSH